MFMLNPDQPNPGLLNMLLHGATVSFDGGCYLKRVETKDGFHVEAGIGLSPHRMRFDLAEGELCLRKVAEWFASKRNEILLNVPTRDAAQGIEPTYKKEYVRTVREEPVRTQVFAYDEILVTVTTGNRRRVTLSTKEGDSYNVAGLPVDVWRDINEFVQETEPHVPRMIAPHEVETKFICQQCQKTFRRVRESLGLLTSEDDAVLKKIESGEIKFKDQPPPGPVYHGQVAPAYQQPSTQRVVIDGEEGHQKEEGQQG